MNKKIKIFSGPNNYDLKNVYKEEDDEFIIGVDSGLTYLVDNQIHINLAIGDFDSIPKSYISLLENLADKVIQLPVDKNMTDLAFAIEYIYNNYAYDEVEIYGGIGNRIDHFLANVNLLKRFQISFRDNSHYIYVLKKGKHQISNPYQHISFFAMEDCYELSLRGFRFPLDNYFLTTSDSICVSNEGSGIVEFSKGRLLVVCSNDENLL